MALLDGENNYIRLTPVQGAPEMVEVFAYEDTEHRMREKTNHEYLESLLIRAEELKELRYAQMIDHAISLGIDPDDSSSNEKDEEYLAQYPSLKEKKHIYDTVFREYLRIRDYMERKVPPTIGFPLLEQYVGNAIYLDRFAAAPKVIAISIGKKTITAQQAYEEVKTLKVFGETKDI